MFKDPFSKSKCISKTPDETRNFALSLSKVLEGGEVILLFGDLGAGKTLFLQGLAQGLGVKDVVNSPTFNILKLYNIRNKTNIKKFCHVDAYRLSSGRDLEALGIKEIWEDKKIVTAIEWAEKIKDIFPKENYIKIFIKSILESKREIRIIKKTK